MEYTVDYFIKKFEAIPENLFTTDKFEFMGKRCMIGHTMTMQMILMVRDKNWFDAHKNDDCFNEVRALCTLIKQFFGLDNLLMGSVIAYQINNGLHPDYQQAIVKQRVLAALYDIKAKQQSETKERIIYVAFDSEAKKLKETLAVN